MRTYYWLLFCLTTLSGATAAQDSTPEVRRLSSHDLEHSVFKHPDTESLTEHSERGDTPALDRVWFESGDRCLQSGIYETGPNRYTVDDPYPHDEFMMFIHGGVTLTSDRGTVTRVVAGDTVVIPKGWRGLWDSEGYRKFYLIYDCDQ